MTRFLLFCAILLATYINAISERLVYHDVTGQYMQNPAFLPGWQGALTDVQYGVGEVYNGAFNLYQVLPNMPAGDYILTANACYRCGNNDYSKANQTGNPDLNTTFIYAGNKKQVVKGLFENTDEAPNTLSEISMAFQEGMYFNTLSFTHNGGDLTIGICNTGCYGDEWAAFDNFTLKSGNKDYTALIKNADFSEGLDMKAPCWDIVNSQGMIKTPDANKGGGVYRKTNASPYNFGQQVDLPAGKYRFSALTFQRYGGAGNYDGKIISCKGEWKLLNVDKSPKQWWTSNSYSADDFVDNAYLYVSFEQDKPTSLATSIEMLEENVKIVRLKGSWEICEGNYLVMPENETRGSADGVEIIPSYETKNVCTNWCDSGMERESAAAFVNEPEKWRQYIEFELTAPAKVWMGLGKDENSPAQYWNPFADFKLEVLVEEDKTLASGDDFEYKGLWYTVIDPKAKTCKTKEGYWDWNNNDGDMIAGNNISGEIVIPSIVSDGTNDYTVTEIGSCGFINCNELTSVKIPDSVTSIGEYAFTLCESLGYINIPNGMTTIGEFAFSRCSNLTSIDIPEGVTVIADGTFGACESLTSIKIPDSVTSIGEGAFEQCSSLTTINIPDGVTSIGMWAFLGCNSLTTINIPDGITVINTGTFCGCIGLTSIKIPDGVTSIGENAFWGCSSLTSINLLASVTSIGAQAFYKCDGIIEITYTATNPIETPEDIFDSSIYDTASLYMPNATLASVQTTVPWNKFQHIQASDGSVGIIGVDQEIFNYDRISPESGTTVDSLDIIKLWYPDIVVTMSNEAIVYNVTDQSVVSQAQVIWDWEDENLINVILSDPITKSGEYEVVIPNRTIGTQEFYDSNGLKGICNPEIRLHYTVISAGDDFEYEGLWYTIIDPVAKTCKTKDGGWDIGNPIAGNIVSDYIDIPSVVSDRKNNYTVTAIGSYGFYKCEDLLYINLPETLNSIGESAFVNCSKLTSIKIPEGVDSIGWYAFGGCSGLKSINIPEGVSSIENTTFLGCSSLTSIDLPEGVTSIGNSSFSGCSSLTSINIPEAVTSIGASAFNSCSSLTTINIPGGVTSIGTQAYAKCNKIKEITYTATNPIEASEDIFDSSIYDTATLNMPYATRASVQSTKPWNKFQYVRASDGSIGFVSAGDDFEYEGIWYTVIDPDAKTAKTKDNGNQGKGNLVIPSLASDGNEQYSVTEIGEGGFSGSSELLSITLPSTITSIGTNAFADCERLTSFVWTVHSRLDRQVLDEIANPNLLLYVDSLQYSPQGINDNVVAYGKCNSLNLTPGYPFTPLSAFTALSSRMEKRFTQQTAIDGCAGWETIVLPFDATSVYAENLDSELIPFGLITDIYDQHPYWLYQADAHGEWKHAYGIQAGVPYIISTPNNPAYPDFYNVDGPVVFSSSDPQRIAPATTAPYAVTWASGREFRSLWLPLSESEAADAMGLNVGIYDLMEDGEYLAPGSAFHVDVLPKPLEAYVTRLGAERAMKVIGSQSGVIPLVAEDGLKISQDGGTVMLQSSHDRNIEIFSVDGTLLRNVTLKAGEAVVVDSLPQGVCIIAGQKLLIK